MNKELLGRLLPQVVETNDVVKPRNTVESRTKAWKDVVQSFDIDKLVSIQSEMEAFIDKLKVIEARDPNGVVRFTEEEAKDLMGEYLSNKNISEFLEARKNMVRDMVFEVIEENLRSEGVENPELENGEIQVPELGKRFCKEGAGLKDPVLDQVKLKELLGDKYEKVTIKKTIPAKVVQELSEDLLVQAVEEDPEVLEAIQASVVQGKAKSPRFQVRDLK